MRGTLGFRSLKPYATIDGSAGYKGRSPMRMGEFFQLWDEIHDVPLLPSADEIRWKLTNDGQFSVALAYDMFFMATENCPYSELLWRSRAPSRVRFFTWITLKNQCLTADNLAKRNWPHDDLCPLYQRQDEDCHHLFVGCDYMVAVWRIIRRWCSASFAIPADEENTLSDWWLATRRRFRTSYRTDFDSAFMLICWLIWKELNARVFQHVSKSPEQLAEDIKQEIAIWRVAGIFFQFHE
ncbi:Os01g0352000 [Oryza sativa Japonica Group]|uniref:Os01g0352000 protein n=1 Tax=Oryza sativa subsp. japonica TaxID=39947 RepID=A0A0P0V295_ORYSJ|nr:Os01g0352000 [Oryza sativa Japonica Group]